MRIFNFQFSIFKQCSILHFLNLKHLDFISNFKLKISNFQRGFIAITSVLVISAVVMAIALTVSLLGIGEGQSSLALTKGDDNLSFVEGCVEDVMLKIHSNSSYSASSFTRPEGTCSITYNSGGPTSWDLTVTSSSTTYQRKIQVIFERNPTGITLTSWKEV